MHIAIGVIAAFLIRIGLQWIFGKGWGLFLAFLWLAAFVFFGLSKVAPPFPIHLFKGASYTAGTFSVLGIIFGPLIIAKIAIQGSTQNKAKAWVGGLLFCFMSLSVVVMWILMSALGHASRQESRLEVEKGIFEELPSPPRPVTEMMRKRLSRTKTKSPNTEQPQTEKSTA